MGGCSGGWVGAVVGGLIGVVGESFELVGFRV